MTGKRNRAVYQFKVALCNIHPPIWRRIQVREDATLAQLHRTLQVIMGWEDYHLHEFRIGRKKYGVPDPDVHYKLVDVRRTRIHDVVEHVGTAFEYLYDFGDYWQHELLLEAILLPIPDAAYPRCIAGERNGAPEDVGGPGGYENYLKAMADPGHEEHEDKLAWRGPFDAEAISLDEINQQLEKKFRSLRDRARRSG